MADKKEFNESDILAFDKTADLSVRYLRESYNVAKSRAAELSTNGGLTLNLRGHSQQAVRIYSALATLLYATISISKSDDLERFVKKRAFQVPNSLFDIEEWGPVLKIARTVRIGEMAKYQDELSSYKSYISANTETVLRLLKALIGSWRLAKDETSRELYLLQTEMQAFKSNVVPMIQGKLMELDRRNASLRADLQFKEQSLVRMAESEALSKKNHSTQIDLLEQKHLNELRSVELKHEGRIQDQIKSHQSDLHEANRESQRALMECEERHEAVENELKAKLEDLERSKVEQFEHMNSESIAMKFNFENTLSLLEKQHTEALAQAQKSIDSAAIAIRTKEERLSTAKLEIDTLQNSYKSLMQEKNEAVSRCAELETEVSKLKAQLDSATDQCIDLKTELDAKSRQYRDLVLSSEDDMVKKESELGSLLSKLFQAEMINTSQKQEFEKKIASLQSHLQSLRSNMRDLERSKDSELTEKEGDFGALLSKLFEAERQLAMHKKEHDSEVRILKLRLENAHEEVSNKADSVHEQLSKLKANVIQKDVQVVANLFADWTVNETVARVCKYEQDNAKSHNGAPEVEEFDDSAFCEFVTANIISQSTKNVINKTVATLTSRVKEHAEEILALKSRNEELSDAEASVRDELRLCMEELSTVLNEMDTLKSINEQTASLHVELASAKSEIQSLKNGNNRCSAALVECQQNLASAESAVSTAKSQITELSNELTLLRNTEKELLFSMEQLRERESSLMDELENLKTHKVVDKNSFDEAALCESVMAQVIEESIRRAMNAHTNSLSKQLSDSQSNVLRLESENAGLREQVAQGTNTGGASKTELFDSTSGLREKELREQLADLKQQLNECETDLVAANEKLHLQLTSSGVSAEREKELLKQVTQLKEQLSECEIDLVAAKESLTDLSSKVDTAESQLADKEAELVSVKSLLETKDRELLTIANNGLALLELNQQQEKSVILLQALARGYNARASTKRLKIHQAAKVSGVLVALKHTVQGESGWYCGPDGSLYYFVLDEGQWLLTCGPISREQLDGAVNVPSAINLQSKKYPEHKYLKNCSFDLAVQAVDFQGEVYISPTTWKLYFVISVDTLMIDSK